MEYLKPKSDIYPAKDPNFDGHFVYSLNKCNYRPFMRSKLLVMVMYYDTSDIEQRQIFSKAAAMTRKPNHAYAAVNCADDPYLCLDAGVVLTPVYKFYSRRRIAATLPEVKNYTVLTNLIEGRSQEDLTYRKEK